MLNVCLSHVYYVSWHIQSTEYYSDDFESETRPALTVHKKNAMTSRSDPHPQPKYQSLPASMAPEEHWASGRAEPDTTTAVVVHSDSPSHMTSKLHRPFVSLSQVPEVPKTEAVPVWTGQLGGMKLKPSATTMQVGQLHYIDTRLCAIGIS